jgi:hypothetical protein
MKMMKSMLSAAIGALVLSQSLTAQTPVGTAITYAQTNVKKGAVLVNGTWDVAFKLFTAASGGSQVGPVVFKNGVVFTSGTMPTQSLDFGPDAFDGEARFLEIKVRQGANAFALAGARQRLNAVPYALALPGFRTEPNNVDRPNVIGGSILNLVVPGVEAATISGGTDHQIAGANGTIGGGAGNVVDGTAATVGGGYENTAEGLFAVVAGGYANDAIGNVSSILGGNENDAVGEWSTIVGGTLNQATAQYSTVGGGAGNIASGGFSTVPGGAQNQSAGEYATALGGNLNVASGNYSLAAGRRGRATHAGAFVWADSYNGNFNSFATNSFNARATGGFYLYTNTAQTAGAIMSPGDGSWTNLSDRHHKRDIILVDARDVLNKVVNMPVATWNYDSQERSVRHMGPMAQDFHAAFGLGVRETHITTIDADGVALAAIQGLHQVMAEKDAELTSLRDRVASLEKLVQELADHRTRPASD